METGYRRTGRTYAMVNMMVDCIQDGQPEAVVIAHNRHNLNDYIFPMVMVALERRGMEPTLIRKNPRRIEVGGSIIEFLASDDNIIRRLSGRIPCWFVDHAVIDYHTLDEKTMAFLKHYPNRTSKYTI